MTVLVVDDDTVLRILVSVTLAGERFDVVEASGGKAALRLVESAAPSVVVLDWLLPDCPGAHVLAEIKRRHPRVAVLVLTGSHDPEERQRAEELGADAFLTKPFSPIELIDSVDALTEATRAFRGRSGSRPSRLRGRRSAA